MEIRKEVLDFAKAMEKKLRRRDNDYCSSWKEEEAINFGIYVDPFDKIPMERYLRIRLKEEFEEYYGCGSDESIGDKEELLDIANFCMMLYWHASRLDQKVKQK